jgi:adenosylcobinamide kinase/adenosylcobinamide-phosphate guanylyltransferase
MARITLLTGGVRSGKSAYALEMARKHRGKRYFVATAVAIDDEMARRIGKHKADRGSDFALVEEPLELAAALATLAAPGIAVVDCLTVWLGNLYHTFNTDPVQIAKSIDAFIAGAKTCACDLILVTNEVGWGIVPDSAMARDFRDRAGRLNSEIAALAQEVLLFCCGIPVQIKGDDRDTEKNLGSS